MFVQHANFALREGDRDVVGMEFIPKGKIHVASDICQTARRIGDPETQDIVDRTVSEPGDVTDRRS